MTTGITDVDWLDAKVCELSAENERLRAALERIAHQKKTDELTEYEVECASFEDGYDFIIDHARAALNKGGG